MTGVQTCALPISPIGHPASLRSASLEAQVANLADEITYYSHDLDDGLDSGLLSERRLNAEVRIWHDAARSVQKLHGRLPAECRWYFVIRCIIDGEVRDVVRTSERRIRRSGVASADAVRRLPESLIAYSPARQQLNQELRHYLHAHLYYNPKVHEPNQRAVRLMEQLFEYYLRKPGAIGRHARQRVREVGLHRAVCDYIAGMTDRYVAQEYQRLLGA